MEDIWLSQWGNEVPWLAFKRKNAAERDASAAAMRGDLAPGNALAARR